MRNELSSLRKLLRGMPRPIRGAEIGVWEGKLSVGLLRSIEKLELLMIDPYEKWDDANKTKKAINYAMLKAKHRTKPFEDRRIIMLATSERASKFVADNSLDFVFIDGDHRYEHVKLDVESWMPKVRPGGLISGHDYNPRQPGLIKAVHEHFDPLGLQVFKKPGYVWGVWKPCRT